MNIKKQSGVLTFKYLIASSGFENLAIISISLLKFVSYHDRPCIAFGSSSTITALVIIPNIKLYLVGDMYS
ncbi:hypothetical protein [Psychroserpens sp.]|uniref:hypothetical protein n=1 Tax=Psychroserpens sp. TaxID=2020870 RepID=UPI0039E5F0DF